LLNDPVFSALDPAAGRNNRGFRVTKINKVGHMWQRNKGKSLRALIVLLAGLLSLPAQSPDASVRGLVTDSEGRALAGAKVNALHLDTALTREAIADSHGEYSFATLPRGRYNFRAEMPGFQTIEKRGIELSVGDKQEVPFFLSSVKGSTAAAELMKSMPQAPGLAVETIASSVSVVVDENKILNLPLASRNIYSLFLLQPGVTSQGAIVRRGLSFSVHGQRVSGSNYLLDGIDNNNIILTGPVAVASAEAVQEFRMVNSSFSAENGRATSFVAQVVTKAGSNRFHGGLFEFFSHDKLSANTFQNNASRLPKSALRHNQFGYSLDGPIVRNRTFFLSALESSRLRYSTSTPGDTYVPTSVFIEGLRANSQVRNLLTEIPPVPSTPGLRDPNIGVARYDIPNSIDTLFLTERLDHHFRNTRDRLLARYTLSSTGEVSGVTGGFVGYPTLAPLDHFAGHNTVVAWSHSFPAGPVNDLRAGWSRERISLPRPRSDVPILQVGANEPIVPGNTRQSDQRENNNVLQLSDSFTVRRGRSSWNVGIEYRKNFSNGLTLGLQNEALGGTARFFDGFYLFPNIAAFAAEQPLAFAIGVDRFSSGQLRQPDLYRSYRSTEYAAFVQNDLKLTRRFSMNLGLRYESYGVVANTDRSKDVNFYFGPGSTIEERLARGVLRSTDQNPGDLKGRLYRPDHLNLAPSVGIAWDPSRRGSTAVRAGYAVALDRIFDTLRDLRTNSQQVVNCQIPVCAPRFLLPVERMLPFLDPNLEPAAVVHLDENVRTPYAQNWYAGIQQNVTPNLLLEIGHAGSVGRKLISRDEVNRDLPGLGVLNPGILTDTFLTNAGDSNYLALQSAIRRRFDRGLQFQVSYTYSHAIDNQSDIFEGLRVGPNPRQFVLARFTRQFDARVDRGNANFDQRHNLIFNAIWELPQRPFARGFAQWLLNGWATSIIGGYRSGFPVTVLGGTAPGLRNNRADFVGAEPVISRRAVNEGVQWLERSDFRNAVDHVGTLGRGALPGPGSWNYDFAVLKNGKAMEGRIGFQFRAEFYNALNHANLSVPVTQLSLPAFGQAYFGRSRTFSRFGGLPLDDPARRIQLGLRIQF
jgi:hypothetical protein